MKKVILVVVLLGGLGGGAYYWWGRDAGTADDPGVALEKIERGPIRQTVSCTGKVVSSLDVDIKCKASGTVIKLPFDVSDRVNEDDLLVELDQIDMQRNYDQAKVSLDASRARLATAELNLEVAERTLQTDRARAQASLMSAETAAKDARAKADRLKQLFEKKLASQEECDTAETSAAQTLAALENARIKIEELKTQEQALEAQRQSVVLARTQVSSDDIALAIANDRLKDCVVMAPKGASTQPADRYIPPEWVVTDRKVQTGMIIASGVSNVGGGTTIMTLSDMSRIFVLASVDESDIGKVQVGQPATISVDAYPSIQFAGQVVRIASKGVNSQNVVTFEVKIEVLGAVRPQLEVERSRTQPATSEPSDKGSAGPATQGKRPGKRRRSEGPRGADLLRADLLIPEKKSLLKPEMTANIEMITAEKDDVLLIPVEAVSRQAGQMYANVPGSTPEEPMDRKLIEVGISDNLRYELLAGLNEGDTVVIRRGEADSKWAAGGPQRRPGQGGSANTMRMMRMGSRGGR